MASVTGMGRADRLASHAEAELYERHSRGVFGYCLSRLGAREDAEDATQLTFLHAVRGLRRGVVPAAESAWLFGIARNVCLSRRASAGRRSRAETACDPSELERLASAHDLRRDELIGLERALELLPEQQRRAVLLRDWRGLSYEEVSEQLGVSHAAVETLIFRGRAALAEHLSETAGEPRRRLGSLGGLWSLLDAIKSAFGGAAAGVKIAAAVGTAVAVTGGGIALETTVTRPSATKPAAVQPVPRAAVAGMTPMPLPATSPAGVTAPRGSAAGPGGAVAAPTGVAPAQERFPPEEAPADAAAPQAGGESGAPAALAPTAVAERPAAATPTPVRPRAGLPSLPALDPPSTDAVTAATEPIVAAATETIAVAPLPAVPAPAAPTQVPTLPTLAPLPPPPALPPVPTDASGVPLLP